MMGSRKKALREYVVGFLEMATFDAAVEASRYLCTSCRGKEESDTLSEIHFGGRGCGESCPRRDPFLEAVSLSSRATAVNQHLTRPYAY